MPFSSYPLSFPLPPTVHSVVTVRSHATASCCRPLLSSPSEQTPERGRRTMENNDHKRTVVIQFVLLVLETAVHLI
jgi:hypothetical protein